MRAPETPPPLWDSAADAALDAEIRRVFEAEERAQLAAEIERERLNDSFWSKLDGNS